jgi:hypothetical protein
VIKLNIAMSAFPSVVFPVAFAPINTINFLYRKFGLSSRYSSVIVELEIFFGYVKDRWKLLKEKKLSSFIWLFAVCSG